MPFYIAVKDGEVFPSHLRSLKKNEMSWLLTVHVSLVFIFNERIASWFSSFLVVHNVDLIKGKNIKG